MGTVVFLDMDGVLCTHKAHEAARHKINPEHGFMSALDIISVRLLNILQERYGFKYVLSSTWRKFHDKEWMEKFLRSYEWTGEFHEDWCTPVHKRGYSEFQAFRGNEIKEWLEKHPDVTRYIILDDNSDMREDQKPFFIQTNEFDGFGVGNFWKMEKLLSGNK